MKAWRYCLAYPPKYAATPFSGIGSETYPGRWNEKGTRVVYTASSLSLALLEQVSRIGSFQRLNGLLYFTIEIPEETKIDELRELPSDWKSMPCSPTTQQLGSKWVAAKETLMMKVPSAIVPGEFNYLINPLHQDFKSVIEPTITGPIVFTVDSQLSKGR